MINIEPSKPNKNNSQKELNSDDKKINKSKNPNIYLNKNQNSNKELEIKNENNQNDKNKDSILFNQDDNIPSSRRNIIFAVFLLSDIFLNYDTGVIPASLIEITKEIELDYSEQALLGSLVYLGLSFASIFVSLIFTKYTPNKVCSVVLFLNCISCFIFSFSIRKRILFLARFIMGVTESFIIIYGPVWVNNYSPQEYSATWMGIYIVVV